MSEGEIISAINSLKEKIDSINTKVEAIKSKTESSDYRWLRETRFNEAINELKSLCSK